ncbi:MAG: hypothetical protein ACSHYA_15200 [Opitutaceae bacterium]
MRIEHYERALPPRIPEDADVDVHLFYVVVDDIKSCAEGLISSVSNTSWINELPDIPRATFAANVNRTVDKLVEIFEDVDSEIKEEFGEYMISMSSGDCLSSKLDHTVLPLSELWKAKASGNEGFDFHTETPSELINFGEAKYNSSQSSYGTAAKQVAGFIDDSKDQTDALFLQHLASKNAVQNLINQSRSISIGFSLHSDDYASILENTLNSDLVKNLFPLCKELFIVGIKA